MRYPQFLTLIAVCFLINTAPATADDTALNALLDGLHEDAAKARYEPYFNRYREDAFFLGTDATERWNMEAFKTYAKPSFDAGRGWTYRVVDRNLMREGNVAWFDEQLDNEKLGRCRGTGVAILENGEWRLAHYSLTMLVPNAIADTVGEQTRAAMQAQQ